MYLLVTLVLAQQRQCFPLASEGLQDSYSMVMDVTEYQLFRNKESMKAASFLCSRVSCAPQEIPGLRKLQGL